ncbi:hypothetical protein N783_03165 [Pontibacillus marinus BH030004 = DSM 16465]|uniref:Uncharacterized protein n=1 Tax=Pontibacillus marinus BH030004 = DSM 16465 TaxID=1385511 RepID=A0A0A5G9V0_9BACI|nr:hypothetical protein N783_03165 [Pontibacillus marinus BH030004 = DSM 16465]
MSPFEITLDKFEEIDFPDGLNYSIELKIARKQVIIKTGIPGVRGAKS